MRTRIIIITILILVFIGGGITIELQRRKINSLAVEREQLIKVASDSGRIARTYLNLHGQEVSKNKALDLSLRNARELRTTSELAFLQQFDGLKKKIGNLESALRIKSVAIVNVKLLNRDSVPSPSVEGAQRADESNEAGRFFTYQDQYNFINGLSGSDSTAIYAEIQVPIDGAIYWKRKHHFIFESWRYGKKEYFSELTCPNKWVTLTNHEFIRILKR